MKFIKQYVPDKRYEKSERPVMVETNVFFWFFWKVLNIIEGIAAKLKKVLENNFEELGCEKEE